MLAAAAFVSGLGGRGACVSCLGAVAASCWAYSTGVRTSSRTSRRRRIQTALPRIRSAARRASDSDSRTIFSRATATSRAEAARRLRRRSAVPRRWSCRRPAGDRRPASPRKRSRNCAASRLAACSCASVCAVASLKRASASSYSFSADRVSVSRASRTVVDRLEEELAHDHVIDDEDHHDREQR